jgi:hypothetical protein
VAGLTLRCVDLAGWEIPNMVARIEEWAARDGPLAELGMKPILALAFVALAGGQSLADDAPTYLICTGTVVESQDPVRHQLVIYADKADIDGHDYRRQSSETNIVLIGPEPQENSLWQISRLDGGYFIVPLPSAPPGTRGHALETSRADRDQGCKKVEKLF